jgi:hypothetical protein
MPTITTTVYLEGDPVVLPPPPQIIGDGLIIPFIVDDGIP